MPGSCSRPAGTRKPENQNPQQRQLPGPDRRVSMESLCPSQYPCHTRRRENTGRITDHAPMQATSG